MPASLTCPAGGCAPTSRRRRPGGRRRQADRHRRHDLRRIEAALARDANGYTTTDLLRACQTSRMDVAVAQWPWPLPNSFVNFSTRTLQSPSRTTDSGGVNNVSQYCSAGSLDNAIVVAVRRSSETFRSECFVVCSRNVRVGRFGREVVRCREVLCSEVACCWPLLWPGPVAVVTAAVPKTVA
jgi:hypothetical protein